MPHPPQFVVVLSRTHCPLHSVYPPLHTNEHVPDAHTAVAFGTSVMHRVPHDPQLFTSDDVSTQLPLHVIGALVGHAATHA
jgi:hypothetical protein